MIRKILVAAALATGMSGAAFAQDMSGWDPAVADAFVDSSTGTLRSAEEVQANFSALTEEQQAQVRADCELTTASVDPNDQDRPTQDTALAELCDIIE